MIPNHLRIYVRILSPLHVDLPSVRAWTQQRLLLFVEGVGSTGRAISLGIKHITSSFWVDMGLRREVVVYLTKYFYF
jgi:hypothetical protein